MGRNPGTVLFHLHRQRLKGYLWWLLLPPLVRLGLVMKQHPLVDARPLYRTSAKLLISPNSRGSDLEFNPMTDPRTVQEITQDQELLQKVVARAELPLSWVDLRSQVQVSTAGHLSDKVDMVEIVLTGSDPDQLEKLGSSFVACLMERMRELASLEQDKLLKVLNRECKGAYKQFQQTWRRVRRFGVQPQPSESLRLAQLQASRAELERELAQLEIAPPPEARAGSLETEVERERLALAALRQVYLDRSLPVLSQSLRLQRLSALLRKERARAVAHSLRLRQAREARLRARLQKVNREITSAQKKQPSVKQLLQTSLLERELQMWQGQLHALQRQSQQVRLEREKRVAVLTLVLLERPQRGQLIPIPSARWTAWQIWLKRLPESLFFGVLLSFLVHFLRGQFLMESRIEEALGLPILGRIPRVPGELTQDWERTRQISAQHPRAGH